MTKPVGKGGPRPSRNAGGEAGAKQRPRVGAAKPARPAAGESVGRAGGQTGPKASGAVAAKARPNEVRLIGGLFKRSKLPVADKPGLRPTPDRVRETLFNWLGQDLAGWRVLDAFAGSGALGLEAASRGAAQVLLLEQDAQLVASLAATAQRLGAAQVEVRRADALGFVASAAPETFELVLLDPPFDAGLALPAARAAARLLVPGGYLYVESGEPLAEPPEGLVPHRAAKAGAVHYALWRRG